MSWDIYGNPLARGHCEVHPHIHEEYPCSICLSEIRQREQATQQSETEHYMQMEIDQLKRERDELINSIRLLLDEDDGGMMAEQAKQLIERIEGGKNS